MILLIHHENPERNKAFLNDEQLTLSSNSTFGQLTELAVSYPDEWIGWTNKEREPTDWDDLKEKASLRHIMVSKGVSPAFLNLGFDYVKDSPFENFKSGIWYPTWIMSKEMGMIHSSILQKPVNWKLTNNFEYDLNLFTKLVQRQGLFCYSKLTRPDYTGDYKLIYSFVSQTMKKQWSFFLLLCHLIYEKRFCFFAFAKASLIQQIDFTTDLKDVQATSKEGTETISYDVVIPTMGRAAYLKNVLGDLAKQKFLPHKVIVIEQNEIIESVTELDYIKNEIWPFEIVHRFIHQTGACNARNVGIGEVESPWVLLFDDDVRIDINFAEDFNNALRETKAKAITFACLQAHESENQITYKQWPYFGSGCSIVHREIVEKCKFDMSLEHGYGEDTDYGIQIRNSGYDIIYAPQIQILHLKAPIGGFRKPHVFPWQNDDIQPKPSPQIMYHRKKNHNMRQLLGYKMILFLKTYGNFKSKIPWVHLSRFQKAWNKSDYWSRQL